MKTIDLTKVNQVTVVKVLNDGVLQEQHVVNKADFSVALGDLTIKFPNNPELERVGFNYENISTATKTALGTPTTNFALVTALTTGKYFIELA